ncbi:MAG TPA: D-alanyl-D-alanine carboxypeptidase/D-alanyl-D-alanine-endopeptidase [Candidatus Elarobacter sp.]|nr:D-alanyl-D-alanine carboxypeptidase/D-alanyl-D-alanine-endopeptidase [Candidatus Elarobacter sp.]
MLSRPLRLPTVCFGLLLVLAASGAPARAVDRVLGAGVPKPSSGGAPWTAADVAGLDATIDRALDGAPTLRGAHAGLLAVNARDGRVLYARGADDAFVPASTLKLLAGSAALDVLGPGFRFRTAAFAVADASGGPPDVVLRGGGDALLDDAALGELPAALRRAGIASVRGIAFDEPPDVPPYPPGWSWDDLPWAYAAPVTQLAFNDNAVTLNVAPGAAAGAPVSVTVAPWGTPCASGAPCAGDLGFVVRVAAVTGAPGTESTLDVTRGAGPGGAGDMTLIGSLAAGAPSERLDVAVPSPPRYAAYAARRALVAAGFAPSPGVVGEAVAPGAVPVWTHDSEPMRDILADLWIPSDNLVAEELLRALGARAPAPQGSTADGLAKETSWLRALGVATDRLALDDGSGLSVYDRVTPRALVAVLKHDWDGPYRELVLDDLPIAGVRGTLAASFTGTPAAQRVFAKTGTVSHASALAGYVATAHHGTVIFAFPVDDWLGDAAALRAVRAQVLSAFAER